MTGAFLPTENMTDHDKYLSLAAEIRKALGAPLDTPPEKLPSLCRNIRKNLLKILEKLSGTYTITRRDASINKLVLDALNHSSCREAAGTSRQAY